MINQESIKFDLFKGIRDTKVSKENLEQFIKQDLTDDFIYNLIVLNIVNSAGHTTTYSEAKDMLEVVKR